MSRTLLLDRHGPFRRAALLERGILTDLAIDRDDRPSLLGAVLLGKVTRLAAGLDAAFVEIGEKQQALLNANDVRPGKRDARIGQLLRTGQTVIVQVKADAHGAKGATVTMDASLPGRFVVHAPLGQGLHVSRRLGKGPEVGRLKQLLADALPRQGGWILRADALGADPALVLAEAEAHLADWHAVQSEAQGTPPRTLRPAPTAAERALVEWTGGGVDTIRVEGADLLAELRAWCRARAPDLEPLLTPHKGPDALFEAGDVDGAIRQLLGTRVPLPQGGSLVIERTEALTVVDVNGGERGNALATNLDACREIARQLRLRNLGGIVVVDFVSLSRAGDREAVLQALSTAVSDDPAGTHVYGMSKLGLVELTRARRGPPLSTLLDGAPGGPGAADPDPA